MEPIRQEALEALVQRLPPAGSGVRAAAVVPQPGHVRGGEVSFPRAAEAGGRALQLVEPSTSWCWLLGGVYLPICQAECWPPTGRLQGCPAAGTNVQLSSSIRLGPAGCSAPRRAEARAPRRHIALPRRRCWWLSQLKALQPLKLDPRLWRVMHVQGGTLTRPQCLAQLAAWLSPRRNIPAALSLGYFPADGYEFTQSDGPALKGLLAALAGSTSLKQLCLRGYEPHSGGPGGDDIQLPALEVLEYSVYGITLAGSLAHLTALTRLGMREARLTAELPPSLRVLSVSSWLHDEIEDPFPGTLLDAIPAGPLPQLEQLSIDAWTGPYVGWLPFFQPLGVSALGGLTALRALEISGFPPPGFVLQTEAPSADPLAGFGALTRLERLHLRGVHSRGLNPLNISGLQRLAVSGLVCFLLQS